MKTVTYMNGRPRSVHAQATQLAAKRYTVNVENGLVYNQGGQEIGNYTYEPRVSVRLEGNRQYGVRINKLVGFVQFGPEALRKGVSVRHKDGDKFNNRGSNLVLSYNREAAKALRRRQREAALLVG